MSHIHIVLLTAKGQDFDRQRGQEVGADLYMTKPFDPDALLAKAREVLGPPTAGCDRLMAGISLRALVGQRSGSFCGHHLAERNARKYQCIVDTSGKPLLGEPASGHTRVPIHLEDATSGTRHRIVGCCSRLLSRLPAASTPQFEGLFVHPIVPGKRGQRWVATICNLCRSQNIR
jgi:hypothetical protein